MNSFDEFLWWIPSKNSFDTPRSGRYGVAPQLIRRPVPRRTQTCTVWVQQRTSYVPPSVPLPLWRSRYLCRQFATNLQESYITGSRGGSSAPNEPLWLRACIARQTSSFNRRCTRGCDNKSVSFQRQPQSVVKEIATAITPGQVLQEVATVLLLIVSFLHQ